MNNKKGLRKILEEFVMTYAVVKWLALAVVSGICVGGAVSLFVKVLEFSIHTTGGLPILVQRALLPVGLVLSALMVRYLAPDASGHGTEKVVEAVHERSGRIDVKVVPVKLVTTVVTVAAGGSAGKEGPATQIAAGITSTLAGLLKLSDDDRKKLVICGVSAGFAAVFGTPVSGAVFALEVLFIGQIYYDVLFPSFLSGVVAWRTANALGMTYSLFPVQAHLPAFTVTTFMWTVLAGVFFGLVSICFIEIITFCEKWFHHVKLSLVSKALLGAALILGTSYFAGDLYFG
ncbi:MAG: chloride channel protein, partial [Pyramidobacter sp.]|nr:chloride channel protein [Pyramidobacter sp.]